MSAFATAATAAISAFHGVFGESATYTRGSGSVVVTAIRVDRDIETEVMDGVFRRSVEKTYIIKKTDLVISSSLIIPARSDTITVGGTVYRYSRNNEDLIDTGEYQILVEEVV